MLRLSSKNPRIAEIRALARQRRARAESGRFLIEGPKLISEALAAGVEVEAIFVDSANGWDSTGVQRVVDDAYQVGDIELFELDAGLLDRIGASRSPQPVLAVANTTVHGFDTIEDNASLVLVAVDVNDPGNMGTLMRSAVAAGADAIVSLGTSVDVFSPKTVRSSAGAMFHVPIVVEGDPIAGLDALAVKGFLRVGTAMDADQSLPATDLTRKIAIVMGSEAHGLAATLGTSIDEWVSIPMVGPTESLNVAMAATIMLYESLRQRQ